ncbi:hypothetical protein PCL_08478 [Purpureocillium lilacinum]|uniref:Uncharacterized protein n=1 Tax=Purpureocillium lilacinum TaxID=33203 RepID=A0A2U3DRJ2_PURLI|nr:hypothetical protein PCL_08478 [Purpureocillium lilacinum]
MHRRVEFDSGTPEKTRRRNSYGPGASSRGGSEKMRRPGRSWDGGGGDAMEVKIETAWQKRRRREVKMHETLTRFGSRAPPKPGVHPSIPPPPSLHPPSGTPKNEAPPARPRADGGLRWSTEEPSQPVVEPPFRSAARCKPPRCAYKRPAFPLAQPARRSCAGPAARRASSAVVHQTNQAPAQAPSSAPARLLHPVAAWVLNTRPRPAPFPAHPSPCISVSASSTPEGGARGLASRRRLASHQLAFRVIASHRIAARRIASHRVAFIANLLAANSRSRTRIEPGDAKPTLNAEHEEPVSYLAAGRLSCPPTSTGPARRRHQTPTASATQATATVARLAVARPSDTKVSHLHAVPRARPGGASRQRPQSQPGLGWADCRTTTWDEPPDQKHLESQRTASFVADGVQPVATYHPLSEPFWPLNRPLPLRLTTSRSDASWRRLDPHQHE